MSICMIKILERGVVRVEAKFAAIMYRPMWKLVSMSAMHNETYCGLGEVVLPMTVTETVVCGSDVNCSSD